MSTGKGHSGAQSDNSSISMTIARNIGKAPTRSTCRHRPGAPRGYSRLGSSMPVRHDPLARHRGEPGAKGEDSAASGSSPRSRPNRATPSTASIAKSCTWSTPSSRRPRATAARNACCSCTAQSAAPRAPSPGFSQRVWSNIRAPTRACCSRSPGRSTTAGPSVP